MTRQELEAEARRHVDDYVAGLVAESDQRLIESISDGSLTLAAATATMEEIHAAARAAIEGLVRQAVRVLEQAQRS